MNEEERWALEYFKSVKVGDNFDIQKELKCREVISGILLKQQKEIKARLKEIDSLYKMMSAKDDEIEKLKEDYQILKDDIEGHRIAYVDTPEFEENYISKDKIKELIKEKAKTDTYNFITIAVKDIEELLQGGQESDQEGGQEDEFKRNIK